MTDFAAHLPPRGVCTPRRRRYLHDPGARLHLRLNHYEMMRLARGQKKRLRDFESTGRSGQQLFIVTVAAWCSLAQHAQANGDHPDKTRGRHQPVQAEAVRRTATAKSPAKRGDSEQNKDLNGQVRSLDSISSNGIAQTCRPFCRDVHRPASPVAFVPALEFTDESGLHRAKYEFRSKRRGIGAFRRYRLVSACRSWEWRRRTGLEKGHRVSYLPFGRGYRCGGPYSSPGPSVLCRG